jgi:hypothetical protein
MLHIDHHECRSLLRQSGRERLRRGHVVCCCGLSLWWSRSGQRECGVDMLCRGGGGNLPSNLAKVSRFSKRTCIGLSVLAFFFILSTLDCKSCQSPTPQGCPSKRTTTERKGRTDVVEGAEEAEIAADWVPPGAVPAPSPRMESRPRRRSVRLTSSAARSASSETRYLVMARSKRFEKFKFQFNINLI